MLLSGLFNDNASERLFDYHSYMTNNELYWAKWKLYTFIIQIANTILNQCISLCLYKIGYITKLICFQLKVICHAWQGDNSYSENRQFIKKSIGCKDQMFFLLSLCVKTKRTQTKCFMKPQCKNSIWDFKDSNYLITSLSIEYIGGIHHRKSSASSYAFFWIF